MASIRHRVRSDGTVAWTVLYRENGRQRSLTFDAEAGARQAKRLIDDLGHEAALDVIEARLYGDGDTPTLREWAGDYIDELTGVTEGTRSRYRAFVRGSLDPLTDLPIDAIDHAAVSKWVNAQERAGLAGKTIANRHGFLYGCLEAAVKAGIIGTNPCKSTRLPTTERAEMVFLDQAEFATLLKYVRPDSRDLVVTLVGTGLRFGEATALQVKDWDGKHSRLTVSRAWKFTNSREQLAGAPKTSRSRRTIAVPPEVADVVAARVKGRKPSDLIFPGPNDKAWKSSAFHSAVWQPAVDYANGVDYEDKRRRWTGRDDGPVTVRARQPWRTPAPEGERLGKRPRIHDLRHSCASWLIQAGVALPVIQRHLGHESIKTTVDRYGHLEPAHLAAVAGALTGRLPSTARQIRP